MAMELERVVFYGRTGEEALAMFELDPAVWAGARVLDCPGGPGSLAALLRGSGLEVTAVDPLYGLDGESLERQARADIDATIERLRHSGTLDPNFDLEASRRRRLEALERFLRDRRLHGGHYVEASLPDLPFADGAFDLVLSGHLLFSYSPLADGGLMPLGGFDLAWHRQALAELLRVSRREVRLYPAHTQQGEARRHPYAEALLAELAPPWSGTFVSPAYHQGIVGCTDGLRITRAGASAPGSSS